MIHDSVNSPSHYTEGGIEVIDYMQAKSTREEFLGYLKLNAIKYLSRCNLKGDTKQDLEKARWYINKYLEVLADDNNE